MSTQSLYGESIKAKATLVTMVTAVTGGLEKVRIELYNLNHVFTPNHNNNWPPNHRVDQIQKICKLLCYDDVA